MGLIRETPILSVGHPADSIGAILAAVGDGSPDNTFMLTRRLEQLSLPQLHFVSRAIAHAPRGTSPGVIFEAAMLDSATVTPEA